jgi:hypothetical protein
MVVSTLQVPEASSESTFPVSSGTTVVVFSWALVVVASS